MVYLGGRGGDLTTAMVVGWVVHGSTDLGLADDKVLLFSDHDHCTRFGLAVVRWQFGEMV